MASPVDKTEAAVERELTVKGFFQLTGLMQRIEAAAAETGELTDEQAAALVEAHAALPETVRELAATLLKLEMFSDYLKQEEERMCAARKRVDGIRRRLEQGVLGYMEREGIDSLTGGTYLLKPRKCPARVELEAGFDDPFFCRVVEIKRPSAETIKVARQVGDPLVMQADKRAIKDALKEGQEIPGARLVQNVKLEIK